MCDKLRACVDVFDCVKDCKFLQINFDLGVGARFLGVLHAWSCGSVWFLECFHDGLWVCRLWLCRTNRKSRFNANTQEQVVFDKHRKKFRVWIGFSSLLSLFVLTRKHWSRKELNSRQFQIDLLRNYFGQILISRKNLRKTVFVMFRFWFRIVWQHIWWREKNRFDWRW